MGEKTPKKSFSEFAPAPKAAEGAPKMEPAAPQVKAENPVAVSVAEAAKVEARAHEEFLKARDAVVRARQETIEAMRAARPAEAWIVSKYAFLNRQDPAMSRLQPGVPTLLKLDGWAHNQLDAGFFEIVPAPQG